MQVVKMTELIILLVIAGLLCFNIF